VEAIHEGEPIMMGMFPVANQLAIMLFDSGASHTFINRKFVVKHDIPIGEQQKISIYIRLGDVCVLRKWYIRCL
jgi:hypothetical protein